MRRSSPEDDDPDASRCGFALPLLTPPLHPKVDENAPARPPSAYVIFSNSETTTPERGWASARTR